MSLCVHSPKDSQESFRESCLVGMLKRIVKEWDIQHGRVSPLLDVVEVVSPAAGPTGEAEAEAPGT